eukprot:4869318-Amphidinium_carterae.1
MSKAHLRLRQHPADLPARGCASTTGRALMTYAQQTKAAEATLHQGPSMALTPLAKKLIACNHLDAAEGWVVRTKDVPTATNEEAWSGKVARTLCDSDMPLHP